MFSLIKSIPFVWSTMFYRMATVSSTGDVFQTGHKMDRIFATYADTSLMYLTGASIHRTLVNIYSLRSWIFMCLSMLHYCYWSNVNVIDNRFFAVCEEKSSKLWIAGVVISCIAVLLCLLIFIVLYKKKQR